MTRLLGFAALVLIAIGAIGYYRGWLEVGKTDRDGSTDIHMTIDNQKMHEDEKKVGDQIEKAGRRLKGQEAEK
jgi:hypothetical protein